MVRIEEINLNLQLARGGGEENKQGLVAGHPKPLLSRLRVIPNPEFLPILGVRVSHSFDRLPLTIRERTT